MERGESSFEGGDEGEANGRIGVRVEGEKSAEVREEKFCWDIGGRGGRKEGRREKIT